jgi:hypothetical protein
VHSSYNCFARIGLTSSSLPHDVIQKLQTEDDLLAILSSSSIEPDTQPLPEMTPPLPETTQPLPETTQPLPETTQPLPETPQPLSETTQPLPETTQPTSSVDKKRKRAIAAQQKQAERIVKRSRVIMKDCTVGDNVAVPIPSVDRGRGDSRNILGVILAVVNGQYTIGCFSGILKGKYSRHQFDLCPQRLRSESDINSDSSMSLRQANKKES